MRTSRWLLLPSMVMALSVLPARAAPGSGAATVSEFAFHLSRAMGRQPADQPAAVIALKTFGVDLGTDVNASLTAGRVAVILRDLGFKVVEPQTPAVEVSAAKAIQIVQAVALSRGRGSRSPGWGRRHGCHVSPSDPEDCDDDDGDHDDGDDDHDGDDGGHHGHGGHHDHDDD